MQNILHNETLCIKIVHEGQKGSQLFAIHVTLYLKTHIYTILKGHEDYKCESCGNFFPQTNKLKTHMTKMTNVSFVTNSFLNHIHNI